MTIASYFVSDPAGNDVPGKYASMQAAQIAADELQLDHEADLEERGLDPDGWGTYVVGARRADGTTTFEIG